MGEPVEGGSGQSCGPERLRSVLERQVGGDDQAGPLVGGASETHTLGSTGSVLQLLRQGAVISFAGAQKGKLINADDLADSV